MLATFLTNIFLLGGYYERTIILSPGRRTGRLTVCPFSKSYVIKQDPGTDRMREIADAIAEGARAFLASEYRILVIFVAVLFVVIGVGTRNWVTAVCFLTGSLFSTAAGYLGMSAAIRANCRTANAAVPRV